LETLLGQHLFHCTRPPGWVIIAGRVSEEPPFYPSAKAGGDSEAENIVHAEEAGGTMLQDLSHGMQSSDGKDDA